LLGAPISESAILQREAPIQMRAIPAPKQKDGGAKKTRPTAVILKEPKRLIRVERERLPKAARRVRAAASSNTPSSFTAIATPQITPPPSSAHQVQKTQAAQNAHKHHII